MIRRCSVHTDVATYSDGEVDMVRTRWIMTVEVEKDCAFDCVNLEEAKEVARLTEWKI